MIAKEVSQMHALTSSIFLEAYLPILTIHQRKVVLQTYVLTLFHLALSRGRPRIDSELLMSHAEYPVPPRPTLSKEKPNGGELDVISDPTLSEGKNPWMSVIESSLYSFGKSYLVLRVSTTKTDVG
jgi:hypothetical protein